MTDFSAVYQDLLGRAPRDVFRPAIANLTAGLIFVHNHPSGDPEPSQADLDLTRRLSEVGRVVGRKGGQPEHYA